MKIRYTFELPEIDGKQAMKDIDSTIEKAEAKMRAVRQIASFLTSKATVGHVEVHDGRRWHHIGTLNANKK